MGINKEDEIPYYFDKNFIKENPYMHCIQKCKIDKKGFCVGCKRTVKQIKSMDG